MAIHAVPHVILALLLAPLLPGLVNRVKSWAAGRRGPPVWQLYADLARLWRRGAIFSRSTTWVFPLAPAAGLTAALLALLFLPMGGPGVIVTSYDFLLVAGLFAAQRLTVVLSALDTGSSFEGMGAGRELVIGTLAEPAFLLALAALARQTRADSLSGIYLSPNLSVAATAAGPVLLLAVAALALVFLAENARIPIDDPTTHLELTMVHEVLVLDHSGPDLALLEYGASLKLWIFGVLVSGALLSFVGLSPSLGCVLAGLALTAIATGVVESGMARLRLVRIPLLLAGAVFLALAALVLVAFLEGRAAPPGGA